MGKKATRRELLLASAAALVAAPGAAAGKDADSPVTPTNIEGPFYRPDVPYRTNLRGDDPAGEPFHISGRVTSTPEGKPLQNAIVEIWHCNHDGHYDNELPDFDPGKYLLRGKTKADAHGRYVFETCLPVPYGVTLGQNRPAHVHYKVFAEGCMPLTTQLYFEGDPNLDSDPFPRKGLVKRLQRHEAPEELRKHGLERPFFSVTFDIVLERARKAAYNR
jgi:protocatechuate 3,4-dioxygenase beta subunit